MVSFHYLSFPSLGEFTHLWGIDDELNSSNSRLLQREENRTTPPQCGQHSKAELWPGLEAAPRLIQAPRSWGVWKPFAGLLDGSQNVSLIFNLLALVASCHADLIVKHRFVCLLTTLGKMGSTLFLSW